MARTARIKGQYETCRRLLAEELGVEPATETRIWYEQIRQGKLQVEQKPTLNLAPVAPAVQMWPPRHNLPYPAASFFGRQKELGSLLNCLSMSDCRLLSLVGPGGIGKTRLALQTAKTLVKQPHHPFADGIYIVPLGGIQSIEALVPAPRSRTGNFFLICSQKAFSRCSTTLNTW